MDAKTLAETEPESLAGGKSDDAPIPALVLLWSADEPFRAGEVALVPPMSEWLEFGRGNDAASLGTRRLQLCRQRPGHLEATSGLAGARISRTQLRLRTERDVLTVENVGQCRLVVDGRPVERATLAPGSLVEIGRQAIFLVTARSATLAPIKGLLMHPFGFADAWGIVGESEAIWQLRRRIVHAGSRADHVLVLGPSGAGKELVASAIHRASPREGGPLTARSAATFPDTLIDAELFGNARGFPNPTTPERPGLVGEASGGTLFLDEIGELPLSSQGHLLRLMDKGEYHRLGEARARTAQIRLIGATNRAVTELKHDFAPRFPLRIAVPGLDERLEDIPLIAQHLLRQIARTSDLSSYLIDASTEQAWYRLSPALVRSLVQRRPYTTHARELYSILLRAVENGEGDTIGPPDEEGSGSLPPPSMRVEEVAVDDAAATIQRVLDESNGVIEVAYRALGLANRHVLARLVRKHGLVIRKRARGVNG